MAPVRLVAVRAGLTRIVEVTARAVVVASAAAAVVALLRSERELIGLVWGWHRAASNVEVLILKSGEARKREAGWGKGCARAAVRYRAGLSGRIRTSDGGVNRVGCVARDMFLVLASVEFCGVVQRDSTSRNPFPGCRCGVGGG